MDRIDGFQGPYRFLSNFWPCDVELDGMWYTSVEHAYQAAKTKDEDKRNLIRKAESASQAKKMGRLITVRSDWDEIKLSIMEDLLIQKFARSDLKTKLLETGEAYLEETNVWGDTFWGVCRGVGSNHLGNLLMLVRTYYQNDLLAQGELAP